MWALEIIYALLSIGLVAALLEAWLGE